MSQTNSAWKVIPKTAKGVALTVLSGLGLLIRLVLLPTDPQMQSWQEWQKDLFAFGIPLILVAYVLFAGFVYGDAKRRGMRYVMWTVIAALMPYAIGVILYFVVRDPLLPSCPNCGAMAQRGFAYCPKCGGTLTRSCKSCNRAVELGWEHCAYCGADLGTRSAQQPPEA